MKTKGFLILKLVMNCNFAPKAYRGSEGLGAPTLAAITYQICKTITTRT